MANVTSLQCIGCCPLSAIRDVPHMHRTCPHHVCYTPPSPRLPRRKDGSSTIPSADMHPMWTATATMPETQQHRTQPWHGAHLAGQLPTGSEQVQVGQGQGGPLGHGFRACSAAARPYAGPPSRLTKLPLWWLSCRQPVPEQGGRVGVCLGAGRVSQPRLGLVQQAAQGLGRILRLLCCCQPLHRHGLV